MKISAGFPTFTVLLVVYCMFKGLPDSWMLYGLFAFILDYLTNPYVKIKEK